MKNRMALLLTVLFTFTTFFLMPPLAYAVVDVVGVNSVDQGTFTAGEALSNGDIVYIKASDGEVYKADTDLAIPAYGIVKAGSGGSVANGALCVVARKGRIIGESSLTVNGRVYLTATAGTYDQTGVAAYLQPIGNARNATTIDFNIDSTYNPASKFTTGDFSGAVGIDGNFDVNTNKFNVTAASGNTTVAGTFGVTGLSTLASSSLSNTVITSTLDVTGDITANGGFYFVLSYADDNITTAQAAVAMKNAGSSTVSEIEMPWGGSLTGISINTNESRTAGSMIADPTVNGSVTGLTATLDGTNADHHSSTQAKDTDTFSAGDRIGIKFTSSADWAPVTADHSVTVYVESGGND